jgi:hypothetical protein
MADSVSECSTLDTDIQLKIIESSDLCELESVHNGVVFTVSFSDGSTMRCVLAGVVCPAKGQRGYELSKNQLLDRLGGIKFNILLLEECEQWYALTHAMPVSVMVGNYDLRLQLLRSGWVQIDSQAPRACRKALFTRQYWQHCKNLQAKSLVKQLGLNRITKFVHPKIFFKANKIDSPDIFYATNPPKPLPYQPYTEPNLDNEDDQ